MENNSINLVNSFKYRIMLFKLFTILATFQKYIYKIVMKKFVILVIIHLNNILIYIKYYDIINIKVIC